LIRKCWQEWKRNLKIREEGGEGHLGESLKSQIFVEVATGHSGTQEDAATLSKNLRSTPGGINGVEDALGDWSPDGGC